MEAAAGDARDARDCLMRHSPFHYSYVALFAGTLGKVWTSPGQSPCIGVAIEDIRKSVGMSRTLTTVLYLVATTTSACILPFSGKLIDSCGPRKMVTIFAT